MTKPLSKKFWKYIIYCVTIYQIKPRGLIMAKVNYNYEKRARELEKQRKKEEKRKKKEALKNGDAENANEETSDTPAEQE